MESILKFKVNYGDTDAYKVAWHGSYLRWMEEGRVDILAMYGVDIKKLDEDFGIVMPVVELNMKYKQSAKLLDTVIVKTRLAEVTNIYVIFEQKVEGINGEIYTMGTIKGVGIKNGKIIRNLKEIIKVGTRDGIFA